MRLRVKEGVPLFMPSSPPCAKGTEVRKFTGFENLEILKFLDNTALFFVSAFIWQASHM
jgi:hypothetical protein